MKRDLGALEARVHDVLVVGGGIAGAWTVWEAASRGLSAALIESDDFGQGASWSSLKTAHGGLRHLQRADFAGFHESVRERRALLRVAPGIVRPLPFAVPNETAARGLLLRAGGIVNDALSSARNDGVAPERRIPGARSIPAEEFGAAFPGLPAEEVRSGAFVFFDAQVTHTERLVVALLRAASDRGAVMANHAGLESGAFSNGVWSVKLSDALHGKRLDVRARSVVNATGGSLESVASALGHPLVSPPFVRGMNLVLDRRLGGPGFGRLDGADSAFGARHAGRYGFLVPWNGVSMLGTAYDDGRRPLDALVDATLAEARATFPWAGVDDSMIAAVHSGLVPGWSAHDLVSRSFLLSDHITPIVSVITAKYTTARGLAERSIDAVAPLAGLTPGPSVSATEPLTYARPLDGAIAEQCAWAREHEMAVDVRDVVRGRLEAGARGPGRDDWKALGEALGDQCDEGRRASLEAEFVPRRGRNMRGLPPPS